VSASLVYEDDLVQLWHGDYRDNLDVLRGLDVDAIITDPPYGDTNLRWDSWPAGWVADAASISRAMWCYGSFRMFHDHATDFAAWKYSQDVVWAKQNGTGLLTDRFRRIHEHAVFWYQGDWASIHHDPQFTYDARRKVVRKSAKPAHLHGATDAVTYTREEGGPRLMTSLIEARNEHGRGIHPTQKPLAAIMPLVEYSVPRGGACSRSIRRIRNNRARRTYDRPPLHRIRSTQTIRARGSAASFSAVFRPRSGGSLIMTDYAKTQALFEAMAEAFRDVAIDFRYGMVRAQWSKLSRHSRRRISKDYAVIRHHRARRDRKKAGK
jgi:site-specific DNA-methyltransferase (adenine-specific)